VFFAIAKRNGRLYHWNFAGAPGHVTGLVLAKLFFPKSDLLVGTPEAAKS
jgi:hypothetical protein